MGQRLGLRREVQNLLLRILGPLSEGYAGSCSERD